MTAISISNAMRDQDLFGPWFEGKSWNGWRAVMKAAFGLRGTMSPLERKFFRSVAERDPPRHQVKELWIVAGRRSGKDSIASLIAGHAAALFDQQHRLRRGERAMVLCLGVDREQAKIVLGYTKSYFTEIEPLAAMVTRESNTVTNTGIELDNGVDIVVATNSFRSTRGRTILLAILDECAYWRDENSATPDEEVYRALTPGMVTLPNSMLVGISSPYRKSGLLYQKFKDFYGKDDPEVLVIKAPTTTLNPTITQAFVNKKIELDPAAARAEWCAEFRDDVGGFAALELIEAAVDIGVLTRPPQKGVRYHSFCDLSGGAHDSSTAAVAHAQGDTVILDMLIEIRAPHSPMAATRTIAAALKSYGLHKTVSDKYAAGFGVDAFQASGMRLEHSDRDRSELYLECLPLFSSGRVRLLDNKRMITQFASLERRTSSLGRDSVNHPKGLHDDACNAAAGALVLASMRGSRLTNFGPIVAKLKSGWTPQQRTSGRLGSPGNIATIGHIR